MKKNMLSILAMLFLTVSTAWADDFTVERAVNLGQLESWADMSQFQWQEIDHSIQDNRQEMDALKTLFYDPAPKDTVGFYNQIYTARDNQYIVLRLDKAQGNRPFHVRVTAIKDTDDPSKNATKVFSAENYVYIMPPIGENQLEVKIWPQGEGEEKAKTFTFNSHSYGSASLRTVMLDKSRIVPGDYSLQLIYYNPKKEVSDTTYIKSLQLDKLYTFYDYNDGDLMEAYLMADNFKRIKLKTEWWAVDAVTHVNDNSVTVMTGAQMPYRQHKRLDAPNPTYLDSRLFSHHDTLWVNLYLDNVASTDPDGLTMHAVRSDFENNFVGEECLKWGLDPVSKRFYVLTDGEPCIIECYRNDYLPKLCIYPGSYDHTTGIIEGDIEEVDLYLEPISAPVTKPTTTSAVLSTLTTTTDRRGDYYVSRIQQADILHELLTETVNYDEYGSHLDTLKYANGVKLMNYAQMEIGVVAPNNSPSVGTVTLAKVKSDAEENYIQEDVLSAQTKDVIYSPLFDYTYYTSTFNLCGYIPVTKSGRPAVAFDGEEVRQLPILCNNYIDLQRLIKESKDAALEQLEPKEDAGSTASNWINDVAPDAGFKLSLTVPIVPPFYFRIGVDADFFKAKKLGISVAVGAGISYDVINQESSNKPLSEAQEYKLTMGSYDDYGDSTTDVTDKLSKIGMEPKNFKKPDENAITTCNFDISAFVELYNKYSFPLRIMSADEWKRYLTGMQWLEETGLRAEANVSVGISLNILNMLKSIGGQSDKPEMASGFQKWMGKNKLAKALTSIIGIDFSASAGVRLNVNTGLFAFDNKEDDGWGNPLMNHILAFRFLGQAYVNAALKAKIDAFVAGAEVGLRAGAGITFKYAGGCRLDFEKPFSGSAWSWYAGFSAYYKAKFFGWSKQGSWDIGRLTVQQRLIKPKNYENPFHPDFDKYLSGSPEPQKAKYVSRREANSSLPGDYVIDNVDFTQPVKFLSGGDSIVYQGAYDNPNDEIVHVASTGEAIYLSDWNLGGCTDYDAASIPGTDLVVLEQATGQISKEDLEDSLHLDETVRRASRVYSVYYTKKHAGTKWYSPKPIYSSPETSSYRPRVALAANGTGVAVWQEGLLDKGSWVTAKDTVQLTDLVMNGKLMMSRFDGNETWTAPIPLYDLNENCRLKDYSISYDGSNVFIIARRVEDGKIGDNICLSVDGDDNVDRRDLEVTDEMMKLKRIGDHNVIAWVAMVDTASNTRCLRVKTYNMYGKEKKGINTSMMLENVEIEDLTIVPDRMTESLDNLAILWRQSGCEGDSTVVKLKAVRLVPNHDDSFCFGTPITAVSVGSGNSIYGFDGYMTDEKIQVCYVAVDSLGYSQLNKKPAYFDNAFEYTVQFDNRNNQGFQCGKDEVTLLVTINNLGTSTITGAMLMVQGCPVPFAFKLNIPAGSFAQERVTVPYLIGTGVNTSLLVQYDNVLKPNNSEVSQRAQDNTTSPTYERKTAMFYPYYPRIECFVAAQHVDKSGDNHITICVRNYARRVPKGNFGIMVGLKENPYSSIVYNNDENEHVKYETKMIYLNNATNVPDGFSRMHDCGSYRVGYVTLNIPAVTEKKQMFVGATFVYKNPTTGHLVRLNPKTFSGSTNSGVVTLYPSPEAASVNKVYNNNDEGAQMHVSQQGNTLVVTGAKPRQQVRLYQANGVIIARQQADDSGKAVFSKPSVDGVLLVSSDQETVKFAY